MSEYLGLTHVSVPLTNVAIDYLQKEDDFIGTKIAPVVMVNKESDKYYTFGKESFRVEDDVRADGAESNLVKAFSTGTAQYSCITHSQYSVVTDRSRANDDSVIQRDTRTVQSLMLKIKTGFENHIASQAFDTATNFVSYTAALSGTDRWSDRTNSNPIKKIKDLKQTVKKNSGFVPNTIVMGQEVYDALCDHPVFIDRVKYTSDRSITTELLARLFEVKNIWIGGAIKDSAKEGQSFTGAYIWGKYVLLCYVPESADIYTPSCLYTFNWKIAGLNPVKVKKYRDEKVDGDRIEVEASYVTKATSASSGYLLSTVVA